MDWINLNENIVVLYFIAITSYCQPPYWLAISGTSGRWPIHKMYRTFIHTNFRQCSLCKYHSSVSNICGIILVTAVKLKLMKGYWILTYKRATYIQFFCIQLSTSISSMQLCECSHVESELSRMLCKWTHCIVHLENIAFKDVKDTVVAWLQHWPRQFILQRTDHLVYPWYSRLPLWQWELFFIVYVICTEQ